MRDPRRHPSECFCRECKTRRETQRQITFAEKLAAERARGATPLEAEVNSRREKRRLDGLAAIAADVAATDFKLERQRRDHARVQTDRRAARFLATETGRANARGSARDHRKGDSSCRERKHRRNHRRHAGPEP